MNIAAVMKVRNEADVLPVNIAYHRSSGVNAFWIVDNGSSDGTTEILKAMSDRYSWLHWRWEPGPFHDSEFVTSLAQDAYLAGADWILPVDADEFWWTHSGSIADQLADPDVGAYECEVENFVQARHVSQDHPASLLSMIYRAERTGSPDGARRLVESGRIGFVEMSYPPKVILRASPSLVIGKGNHSASGYEGRTEPSSGTTVLHAPIRSQARLNLLAEQGRRVAAVEPAAGTSWHLRRWAALAADGRLKSDWVATSQHKGSLIAGGERHPLVPDTRRRRAVAPFVEPAPRIGEVTSHHD